MIPRHSDDTTEKMCQLRGWTVIAPALRMYEIVFQLPHRVKRILKRRIRYIKNLLRDIFRARPAVGSVETAAGSLRKGDLVRVCAREDIEATLSRWNATKGCVFMEEMWEYCGTTQKVLKRVERFLDERDLRVKKCRGIVILEGVQCQGTVDFGPCDRTCHFFWREEWLSKIER